MLQSLDTCQIQKSAGFRKHLVNLSLRKLLYVAYLLLLFVHVPKRSDEQHGLRYLVYAWQCKGRVFPKNYLLQFEILF